MFGKRNLDNLSLEDLEKALRIKRRQVRLERFQQLSGEGYTTNEALLRQNVSPPSPPSSDLAAAGQTEARPEQKVSEDEPAPEEPGRKKKVLNAILLGLEVTAVVGLAAVLLASYFNLRELNDEVAVAQHNILSQPADPATPPPTPSVALARLPGGHTPPTSPGGAVPDVPLHLQKWVQPAGSGTSSAAAIEIEKQESPAPTRIVIPKLNVDAPIVKGVGWEDLKKGVGHLPGSAHPGRRGNLYLAAHNDIYGEIFRRLGDLEPGDVYFIYGGRQKFRYVVKEKRIIEPTDVEVMLPTTEPVATLQTCYPYLINTHRLIVVGELAE